MKFSKTKTLKQKNLKKPKFKKNVNNDGTSSDNRGE